jgi:uncharacterized protein (TIGR03790 family)
MKYIKGVGVFEAIKPSTMKISTLIFSLLIGVSAFGQTSYSDVAVIVNDNSQSSIDIGNYFQQSRNIPTQNMIHITGPTTEEIDSLGFEQIRAQIENYLIVNGLSDSINYIVTTKGVPLIIGGACSDSMPNIYCTSFDSELTLILGLYESNIGSSTSFPNPVFNTTDHFSRDNSGIYLVTRLDGYTSQDVFDLIDRSGPETGLNQSSALAVVDLNTAMGGDSAYFMNTFLQPTYDFLITNTWNTVLDANYDPLLNQSNVFSYSTTGFGPLSNVELNYNWTEGSIASMATCETAATFDVSLNSDSTFLIADLIAEGCTGAQGYVGCNFISQILNSEILHQRYLDPLADYNLAESFYMAETRLSWQSVFIGDPKASVVIDNTASIDPVDIETLLLFPNPSTGIVKVNGNDPISSIVVLDMKGAQVKSYYHLMGNSTEIDLQDAKNGMYIVQIQIGDKTIRERIVINK